MVIDCFLCYAKYINTVRGRNAEYYMSRHWRVAAIVLWKKLVYEPVLIVSTIQKLSSRRPPLCGPSVIHLLPTHPLEMFVLNWWQRLLGAWKEVTSSCQYCAFVFGWCVSIRDECVCSKTHYFICGMWLIWWWMAAVGGENVRSYYRSTCRPVLDDDISVRWFLSGFFFFFCFATTARS
jgi:hypothetical protein